MHTQHSALESVAMDTRYRQPRGSSFPALTVNIELWWGGKRQQCRAMFLPGWSEILDNPFISFQCYRKSCAWFMFIKFNLKRSLCLLYPGKSSPKTESWTQSFISPCLFVWKIPSSGTSSKCFPGPDLQCIKVNLIQNASPKCLNLYAVTGPLLFQLWVKKKVWRIERRIDHGGLFFFFKLMNTLINVLWLMKGTIKSARKESPWRWMSIAGLLLLWK